MRSGWGKLVAVVAMAFVLTGCGSLAGGKRSSNFQIQMLAFENAIRWGEFQTADRFRKRETNTAPTDFSAYEGIRVSSYDVMATVPKPGGNQIMRTVKIQFYRETNPAIRTVTQEQLWEYDAEGEVWVLLGPLPRLQ